MSSGWNFPSQLLTGPELVIIDLSSSENPPVYSLPARLFFKREQDHQLCLRNARCDVMLRLANSSDIAALANIPHQGRFIMVSTFRLCNATDHNVLLVDSEGVTISRKGGSDIPIPPDTIARIVLSLARGENGVLQVTVNPTAV